MCILNIIENWRRNLMTIKQLQSIFSNYPLDTEVRIAQKPYVVGIKDIKEIREYVEMNTNQIELVIKGED